MNPIFLNMYHICHKIFGNHVLDHEYWGGWPASQLSQLFKNIKRQLLYFSEVKQEVGRYYKWKLSAAIQVDECFFAVNVQSVHVVLAVISLHSLEGAREAVGSSLWEGDWVFVQTLLVVEEGEACPNPPETENCPTLPDSCSTRQGPPKWTSVLSKFSLCLNLVDLQIWEEGEGRKEILGASGVCSWVVREVVWTQLSG